MKCIKSVDGVISRVHEDRAEIKVKTGDWMYVPKSEWKQLSYVEKLHLPKSVETATVIPVEKKKKPPKTSKQDKKKR